MLVNKAHTFFISSESVQGVAHAHINCVDVYFKFKPRATNNRSGIDSPGVTAFICETDLNNNPIISDNRGYQYSRVEYVDVTASSDASIATKFRFPRPVTVEVNKWYAIVLKFDGNEDFILWTSVRGDSLIGSGSVSPGASGDYVGNYFEYAGSTDAGALMRPIINTFMKFKVYVSRFFIGGVPVQTAAANNVIAESVNQFSANGNSVVMPLTFKNMEYITFDPSASRFSATVMGGARIYQNTVYHPGGWANGSSSIALSVTTGNTRITANTRYPNGQLFAWSTLFDQGENPEYIVIVSAGHSGGADRVDVRAVQGITSNTVLVLDEAVTFSNSSAKFFVSPVGTSRRSEISTVSGQSLGMIVLSDTNSNVDVAFTTDSIEGVTIGAGGSGYHNSEVIYIKGFEEEDNKYESGYRAVANLVTNSSGGITAIYFSNIGSSFSNTSSIVVVVANSSSSDTANTANGTGLTLTINIGSILKTEFFNESQFFKGCKLYNQAISTVSPQFMVASPPGTTQRLVHRALFERRTTANLSYGIYDRAKETSETSVVTAFAQNFMNAQSNAVNITRARQFDTFYSNGGPYVPTTRESTSINNTLLYIDATSNNDFTTVFVSGTPRLFYGSYMINDDYTNEHTDKGNAWAKHVSIKTAFKDGRFAEDMVVDLTAHRPVGTSVQVYCRMHHSMDTEDEFDDKDWTRLELITGANNFSSLFDMNDVHGLRYTIPQTPNVQTVVTGTATVSSGNVQIVGVGTNFQTAANVGDLVKISQPLFPNNHFIARIDTIDSETSMNLNTSTANSSVLGSGMKVEVLGYPKQVYRDHQADNVATYYAENGARFDTFNTFAIKIILLSSNPSVVPSVDNIKAIGTSA